MTNDRDELLAKNGDGTFSLTAAGHTVLSRALRSSTKFLGYIPRRNKEGTR